MRLFRMVPAAALWAVMILLSLTAAARWLVLPLYLEPLLEREIQSLSVQISRYLRQTATISYRSVALSIDWSGIYLKVIGPKLTVEREGESHSLAADSAGILLDYRDIVPDIFVSGTVLSLAMDEDGNITLTDFSGDSSGMLGLTGLLEIGRDLPPFRLVLHDTMLVLSRPDKEDLAFEDIDISAFPNLERNTYVLAMHSTDLYLRANLALTEHDRLGADWYLSAQTESFNFIMEILGWPARATSVNIQAWGRANDENEHRIIVAGQGYDILLGRDDYRGLARHASIEAQATVNLSRERAAGRWKVRARDLETQTPGHILGSTLVLDRAAAGGSFSLAGDNWRGEFTDLRATAAESAVAGQMILAGGEQGMTISLAAYSPTVNFAAATRLLPDDLGDALLAFLREDLSATNALISTLVVAGNPLAFPWHDDQSGQFLLQVEFAGATLDYLDGYPPIEHGTGRVKIEGARLDVSVAEAQVAGAPASRVVAAIDDMQAVPGTLYIAGNIDFSGAQLTGLLRMLPETAEQLAAYPQLQLNGRQQTLLHLAIPLDTDDPIAIDGRLRLIDSQLAWRGFPARLENLRGALKYSAAGVSGIARAQLWETPVRLSLDLGTNAPPRFEVAGAFDITEALARMEIESASLPLAGTSPWQLVNDGRDLFLASDLRGTRVNLPPPLAKAAAEPASLRIGLGSGPLQIDYANGLLRGRVGDKSTAIAIGTAALPEAGDASGIQVAAEVSETDLDALASWLGDLPAGGAAAVTATIKAASAQLFGRRHFDVIARLAADATATVIALESDSSAGQLRRQGTTISVSIDRLNFATAGAAATATIDHGSTEATIAAAGKPSGNLPPLLLSGTSITINTIRLPTIRLSGQPQDQRWLLESLEIDFAPAGTIFISGDTAMQGKPDSRISLTVPEADMQQLFANLGFEDEVSEGRITVGGQLHWRGAIHDPHYRSLAGTLHFAARDFRMNQLEGGSAKFTRLFSPFTLLTLGFLELGEQGINFDSASGRIEFSDGRAHFHDLRLDGDDISLIISGFADLIDETYDVNAEATVHNSNQIFTAGASLFNPLFAGILFFFDNIAGKPIIKPMEINYSITGPWGDPLVVNDDDPAAAAAADDSGQDS